MRTIRSQRPFFLTIFLLLCHSLDDNENGAASYLCSAFFSASLRNFPAEQSSPKPNPPAREGGQAMIAKIIIKRRFTKENWPQILSLLNKIRTIALDQPGYISGETLMQPKFPENMAVICTWQKMADWECWKKSEERKKYEEMLEIYQTRPTEYEEYLLGTAFKGGEEAA